MSLKISDSVESAKLKLAPTTDSINEFLSDWRVFAFLTVFPAIALFTAITLLPMLWAFVAGFYQIPIFSPEWEFVGFENYRNILGDGMFYHSLLKGAIFAATTIVIQLVVGIGLAILINRDFPFKTVVRGIVFLPYMFPTAILAFVSLWMMNSTAGVVNQLLLAAGLIDSYVGWFGLGHTAMPALIATHSWKYTIFVTIMVLAKLQSIPASHYEAAIVSGASRYQRFRDITLPNLKGVIFIVLLLRGVWNFNKFDIIWVLTQGGPGDATYTAPVHAFEVAFTQQNLGEAAAVSTLLFLILIGVAIIYFVVLEPEQEVRTE